MKRIALLAACVAVVLALVAPARAIIACQNPLDGGPNVCQMVLDKICSIKPCVQ